MSMDHVLKGSKISFCETVVFCHSGHDEISVWQVRHFGLIFRGRRNTYFIDLDKKVAETSRLAFSMFMVRAFFCENQTRARSTLLWLCACRIALAVARCEFCHRSRKPLGTLCGSDRSRCGAILLLADSL